MRLALVAVFLSLVPAATALGNPSRVIYDTVLPQVFYLDIEHEGVREATFVEPRADGMVALTAPNGAVEYVAMSRLRRVTDQDGVDLTSRLRRRQWLGTPPPESPKPSRAPEAWKAYRFRAGSRGECGSFLITDFAVMWTAASPIGFAGTDEQRFQSIDLGYARNLSPTNSLGGSLFFGADGARTHAGLRLRAYHWLARDVSLDLSPGIVLIADEEGTSRFVGPGFSGQAGLRLGAEPGIAGSAVFLVAGAISQMNTRTQFSPSGFTP